MSSEPGSGHPLRAVTSPGVATSTYFRRHGKGRRVPLLYALEHLRRSRDGHAGRLLDQGIALPPLRSRLSVLSTEFACPGRHQLGLDMVQQLPEPLVFADAVKLAADLGPLDHP